MKLVKFQIRNILGIDSLEYAPGKITTISGQNASGKTSVLEAIKAALGGGHDGTLLKNGKDEGEVVLIFDNGETLRKTMNRDKSSVVFEDHEGKKIKQGASYIKEIVDSVGINPIQILTADSKTRIKLLLDSVPMEMPVDEIKLITGLDRSDHTAHPLKVIDAVRKDIYDERAFVNKRAGELTTMMEEMRKTIPFDPSNKKDWGARVGELRGIQEEILNAQVAIKGSINSRFSTVIKDAEQLAQKGIDDIKEILAKKLGALNEEHRKELDESEKKFTPRYEEVSGKIQEADLNSKNQTKISGAVEYVERTKKELKLVEEEALSQSEQIKSLDGLKAEMMQNLPIDNLEVKDGDIYINGVNFDTLNEASKISFCLMVAGLRKTKLPLVCVDGLEALDEEVFKKFVELAERTDMQFFVTRVSEDESLTLK